MAHMLGALGWIRRTSLRHGTAYCAAIAIVGCQSQDSFSVPPSAAASQGTGEHTVGNASPNSAAPAMGMRGTGSDGLGGRHADAPSTTTAASAGAGVTGGASGMGQAGAADGAGTPGASAGTGADTGLPTAGMGGASASTQGVPQPTPCEAVPAGEQLAFPGAEGFGRFSRGGRGGTVCHVTTLEDSGAGSLRDCVSDGDRTVVFDVAGWITLKSNLGITSNRITLAGQTAPGGGIGARGRKVSIGGSDIIMRFMRVRRGIIQTTDRNDAMAVSSKASRVIIDHCSVGFGTDENLSMPGDEGVGPQDLTVQWTAIAWGLQRNNHSAGSLLTANGTTIHHSVYAFHGTRNPKARSQDGRVLDFVNNVIYGWNAPDPVGEAEGWSISKQAFLLADTSNGSHNANAVGNYFIAHGDVAADKAFSSGDTDDSGRPTFHLYFEDNLLDGNANAMLDVSKDDWSMVGTAEQLSARLPAPQVCTQKAAEAFEHVMSYVGASVPARDEVDAALVQAIRAQSGIKIQDEHDLEVGAQGYGELAPAAAPPDADGDGMPDSWELAHGLDPQQAQDGVADADGDGYTNLESYLNELAAVAFPL